MKLEEITTIAKAITNLFSPIGETTFIQVFDDFYTSESFRGKFNEGTETERENKKILQELKKILKSGVPQYYNRVYKGKNWKCVAIPLVESKNNYILIVNFDVVFFQSMRSFIDQIIPSEDLQTGEKHNFSSLSTIQSVIGDYCFKNNLNPIFLKQKHKKEIVKMLEKEGLLELKNSINLTSQILGVSRATIYNYLNK